MIPGTYICPSNWTHEYYGYLMTERSNHPSHKGRTTFECVDVAPELAIGGHANHPNWSHLLVITMPPGSLTHITLPLRWRTPVYHVGNSSWYFTSSIYWHKCVLMLLTCLVCFLFSVAYPNKHPQRGINEQRYMARKHGVVGREGAFQWIEDVEKEGGNSTGEM